MTTEHPITPPLELVHQWRDKWYDDKCTDFSMFLATQSARWGADQELEACCEWLVAHGWFGSSNSGALCGLRTARRPKPPSLAEEGLSLIDQSAYLTPEGRVTIRRALERLKELEQQENND